MVIALQNIKWRTIVGLLMVYATLIFYPDFQWIWGVLLIYWVIPDIVIGKAYFIEPIVRANNPFLYWIIVITWIAMAIYIFAWEFYYA